MVANRNQATDLRWEAGELKDTLQRLLHRAGQIESLAIALTEQDMVSIAKVEEALEGMRVPEQWMESDNFRAGMRHVAYHLRARLREGGAHKG
jgi:hypothetical protein